MTKVVLQNLSESPKVLLDLDSRARTLAPGEKKSVEIHAAHVRLFERDAQKENPNVSVDMSPVERAAYEKELEVMDEATRNARLSGRLVTPMRAIEPTQERMPPVDRRFFTDPQTVHPGLLDTVAVEEPVKKPNRRAKVATTDFSVPVPEAAPKKPTKPDRVQMKKKKE